jgi:phosphoribosylamine-glycine ligase
MTTQPCADDNLDVPYVGVLSTDIMLTIEGPKALRYETYLNSAAAQALLPLLPREANLIDIIQACMNGRLEDLSINLEMKTSVMVSILAAQLDRLDISRPVEIPHRLGRLSSLNPLAFLR